MDMAWQTELRLFYIIIMYVCRTVQMCNVCGAHAMIIISCFFNFRPFEEHGWLLGWHQSGTRSVGSFDCVHLLDLSRACKICVSLTLTVCLCGILHFCNFIYRKRRLHRHSLLLLQVIFFSCFFSSFFNNNSNNSKKNESKIEESIFLKLQVLK